MSRSILLVGEGNFSFSAGVSQSYCGTETTVTATCLQTEEEALRHEGAASSIQTIQDSGGTVLFEVDCTRLGESPSLQGRVFDRVVFNFPHCGRKSGVKKNRELLKNFFISCVQVLAEGGEVHVSLCNGQGGTPADQPKREWHNSWQVTAMAAEARLLLSDVHPFESEKYQSYKCTGYRSQDKGFHVEKGLVHVFTRSLPYTSTQMLKVEEVVEGGRVQYNMPVELSDYLHRDFLCSGSVHPVMLAQDFVLSGLAETWSVSVMRETPPFLLTARQLQTGRHGGDGTHCYWIHLLQKDLACGAAPTDQQRLSTTCGSSESEDWAQSKGLEGLMSTCSLGVDAESGTGRYLLRPSLLPQMEELLARNGELGEKTGTHEDGDEHKSVCVDGERTEGVCVDRSSSSNLLFALSGLVFRNVPINLWAPPAFHELLLRGVFPVECEPVRLLGRALERLLGPYGVCLATEPGALRLTAQPVGLVGKLFAAGRNKSHVGVTVSLNLDLLAVLFFSMPDWRLLWSHDPRLLKQFARGPPPGTPFSPFSLFPERFTFDISFWTGPTWEERTFHAVVREAGRGTVETVKLIDTFSHPDLSQTSYCYRLVYHSNTHALSHTQALQFHKQLESVLSSRLEVTIR